MPNRPGDNMRHDGFTPDIRVHAVRIVVFRFTRQLAEDIDNRRVGFSCGFFDGRNHTVNHVRLGDAIRQFENFGRIADVDFRVSWQMLEKINHGYGIGFKILAMLVPVPGLGVVGTEHNDDDIRFEMNRPLEFRLFPVRQVTLLEHRGTGVTAIQRFVTTTEDATENSRPRVMPVMRNNPVSDTVAYA